MDTRAEPDSVSAADDGAAVARVARNTVANLAGQAASVGIWFALTPFILHSLGPTRFGLWALVGVFLAYGRLLDLGIGLAVTKYVAELRSRDEPGEASSVIATAFVMYCVVGVLTLLASILLAFAAPHVINVPGGERDTLRWVVILVGVAVAIELPATTAYAVLQGLHRFDLVNLIGTAAVLALALAVTVVLLLGGGLIAMVAVAIPLTFVWQLPAVWLIRRVAPELRLSPRGAQMRLVRRLAGFSWSLVVLHASSLVKRKTDELVIGASLSVASVTPYAVARRLSDLPELATYQFAQVLMPVASDLDARDDRLRLQTLAIAGTRIALALFLPIGVALAAFAGPLLAAWVGERYAGADDIVLILVCAGLIDIALWPFAMVLQGMSRHRPLAWFAVGSMVVNLALSIVLVNSIGIKGAAIGTLAATALEALVILPYALSVSAIGLRVLARDAFLPALLPALPMICCLLAVRELLHPSSLAAIAAAAIAGALTYAAGYLLWPANAGDKARARQLAGAGARWLRTAGWRKDGAR